MIWEIKYKRSIGDRVYDKTATFITKEKNDCQAYQKWIKQHTISFIKSIVLVSIGEKYKAEEKQKIGKGIYLNNQTTTNLIQYLNQFPPGSPVKISHDFKNWDCQIACNFEHQRKTKTAQLILGLWIDNNG